MSAGDERAANALTKILIVAIAGPAISIASSFLVARTTWFLLRAAGYVPEQHVLMTRILAVILFAGVVTVSVAILRLMWPSNRADA